MTSFCAAASPRLAERTRLELECPGRWLLTCQHQSCVRDVVRLDEEAVWFVRKFRPNRRLVDDSVNDDQRDMDPRWPERTGEGFGQTALRRLGRSKCGRLSAAPARGGRADENDVSRGAPLHRGYDAARGGEGAESVGAPRRLEVFEGHLLDGAPNTFTRIVYEDIDRSEVRFDGRERSRHHGGIAHIASIGARHGELVRQLAREAGRAGQQRDGISLRGETAGERGAIAGTDTGDDA